MSKYKVNMIYENFEETLMESGSYDDAVFDTEDEARNAGLQACSDTIEGADILHLSRPGEYPNDGDNTYVDYEIIEIDD